MSWMMTKSLMCFLFSLLLLLTSCTPKLPPGQTTQEVASCKQICKQRAMVCQKTCRNNCVQCSAYATSQMSLRYRQYVHEQRIQGQNVVRQLKSYRNPLQCAKTTCNCVSDYQVCMQSCSGFVHKQLLVPPVCR